MKYAWERQPMKPSDLMDGGFDSVVSTYRRCRGWFTEGDRESKLTIRFQITENSTQLNENDKISTRKKEANECIRKRAGKKKDLTFKFPIKLLAFVQTWQLIYEKQ